MDENSAPMWVLGYIRSGLQSQDQKRSGRQMWALALPHRLNKASSWAEEAVEELVEAPGLIERAEFVQDINARADKVGSAQEELQALAEVAQFAQALYFRQRSLELAMLEAADGGATKKAIAAAAGLDRTSVYRWLNKARAFLGKLQTDARLDPEENLVCALCDASFRMDNKYPNDANLAMHRHWTTSHHWDPLEPDKPEGPETDQPGDDGTTDQPQLPQSSEIYAREQATAARLAVTKLIEEHRLASIGGDTVAMLENFAKRADKGFGALKAHIDRNRNESRLLTPVVEISRQVDEQTWMLELSILNAETLEIKRTMIARAADKADATVKKWADNARALIDQMWAQIGLKTGPTDEWESLVCGLCDTEFEFVFLFGTDDFGCAIASQDTYANMYRHWKTAHRISGGSEGVEEGPVGFAGVEQGSDPVVVEVGEPEGDAFDPFDQVVGGLGGCVGDSGGVPVGDLVSPIPDGAAQPVDLGGQAGVLEVLSELVVGGGAQVGVGDVIDASEGLFGVPGVSDLAVGVAGCEQAAQAGVA